MKKVMDGCSVYLPYFMLILCLLVTTINGTITPQEYDNYQEFATSNGQHGLFPTIFNLATNSLIYADATCGQHHPEIYCKLVEHVFNRQPQCDICDANDVRKRHPIEFAIDGTRRWWQSPSLANGLNYERVNITIDLRQEYQVAYVIVKSAIAPRPGTWVLEKSLDGIKYEPWQYYAISDAECLRQFGVPATIGVPRLTRDDEVICTSYYSKLDPLENGEIHTSLVNGRPSAEFASQTLQQFTRARYVRLRLMSLRTLNADLMIINRRDESNRLDLSVTRRYFYAIKDISIGGQCICHGHAESCSPDPVTGQSRCECRHNTCGGSCNHCCPMFNQLPWRQGTQSDPNVCQPCQCFNHADRCEYDEQVKRLGLSVTPEGIFEGGGKCINCKHNTDGINCERCQWTYFRPSGITHYREDACRPCDCDLVGSEHNNCVRDETSAVADQKPGDCICKPGFGGRRCDVCARGYRNYPKCDPCPCNRAGSLNFDTCEEERCICKSNVEGLYCDRCKEGTINLNAKNPDGCQPCFCFGLGNGCHEIHWDRGQIRSSIGWKLTDLSGEKLVTPKTENGILMYNNEHETSGLYYWKAPKEFNGNLLSSYGGNLHYYVYFVPMGDGHAMPIADLIIEGNGIKLEYHSRQDFFPRENISIQIPMKEGTGWYNSNMGIPVDKSDMMRTLADVNTMLVRAKYHQSQIQSSVYGFALDTAVKPKNKIKDTEDMVKPTHLSDVLMRGVEVCQCPEHYTGNSCESCAAGYRRVNNQLYGGRCEKCNCEDHSDECDPFTGDCINCRHNTTGRRCHQCLPGYYGNPSLGGELGQCRPCACPTIENTHSTQCTLTQLVVGGAAAYGEDAFVCTACESGYDGNRCEICADGFFGDPLKKNGTCELCDCTGNIDPMAIGNCDRVTGKCLKCIYNTAGDHCEECKENHWGNPKDKSCRPCGCHPKGALSATCNKSTGACDCHPNYVGKRCDRCKAGHGDIEKMCPPCNCHILGSFGRECDEVSGQCACKMGVFGKHCDMCRESYFNFSENGCQFCHCDRYGAVDDGRCHNVTGKCVCRKNVDGNMCEKCVDGYFNITSGQGCQECGCDFRGSENIYCNMHTGQCVCKPGVTGLKCDRCAPNHFGLDMEGCKECQVCPALGHICDPVSGGCVCPPNTFGKMCQNCTRNAWNYHPLTGCTLCECSEVGAVGPNCNPVNGQCECRVGFVGLKCNRCTYGHFNFPYCEPCKCDLAGTDPLSCKNAVCGCDEKGQCICKKNVMGLKCDTCDPHSFSLEKANPLGCTSCFCFNRTSSCVQSNFVWQQIYAPDRQVTFAEPWEYYLRRHNLNVLKEYPLKYNSYMTDITPLYWSLPHNLLGDRTTSYNGFIRFKIENDDNYRGIRNISPDFQHFRLFPQVVLVGNHRIILEHIPDEVDELGRYKVRLHESQWRSRLSPEVMVMRKQLMIALQNLQGIYIRATYNYPSRGDIASIRETSIDVAVWENITDASDSSAVGVELCDCPQGYAGSSCQDPAEGYCRKRRPDFLNNLDDLALMGEPQLCACNGHSTTCEVETCRCTNCQHNTYGDYCELCKPGYQGDALVGGANACTKCACPLSNSSFSDTCVAVSHGRGYVCDACKLGYAGLYCESCINGYYGNPNIPGGICKECSCHHYGSLHKNCNQVTGQCVCRPGVTGRDCSLCQARHAFINGICTSCDQGCTRDLMSEIDHLELFMGEQNFTNLRPIPWRRVVRINNSTKNLREIFDSTPVMDFDSVHLMGVTSKASPLISIDVSNSFLDEVNGIVEQTKFLLERSKKSKNIIEMIGSKAVGLSGGVKEQNQILRQIVSQLRYYLMYGRSKQHRSQTVAWIEEAETCLNDIRDHTIYIEKRYNRGLTDFKKAQDLMKMITAQMLNDTSFIVLRERLRTFRQWLSDYRDAIWDDARQESVSADKLTAVVTKRVGRFKDVAANITELLTKTADDISEAKNKVTVAKKEKILNMFDDFKHINETLLPQVNKTAKKCRNEADKYEQLLDEYQQEYVEKSEQHGLELHHEAYRLQSSFVDTKIAAADPLRASIAYKEIVEALRNASRATEDTKRAAKDAYIDADPKSETSMVNVALQTKNQSGIIKLQADELSLKELEYEYLMNAMRISELNTTLQFAVKRKLAVGEQYQAFDDQHDRMSGLINVAVDAELRAKTVNKTAQGLSVELSTMSDAVSKLKSFAGEGIRNVTNDVREASQEAKEALKKVSKVHKQIDEDSKRISNLGEQIKLLQEKIKEAREKASRIRISFKSDEAGNCQRAFVSPAHLAPCNLFTMKYRPARNVPDSLLFIVKTKAKRTQKSEYIAMELKSRRIVVHWDIGAGARMITNTHTINYITPGDRTAWYHFILERTGNSVTLTVALRHTISGEGERTVGEPTFVSVGQIDGADDVIFNTVPGETLIEFGIDVKLAKELNLATNKFLGTIGEFTVDGETLPLWAFARSNQICEGDSAAPASQDTGYMFRDGFAQIRLPSIERPSGAQVSVIFAAYSTDGLLYFRGNQRNGDFICLELRDGHVVFKINLGDGSYAAVESKNSYYADGRSHTVRAIKNDDRIHLQVDNENDRTSITIPGQNTLLNINDDDHFVGGISPGFNVTVFRDFDIHWDGFFGCIQSVKPSQVAELDLDNAIRSQRKVQGCAFKNGERLEPRDRVVSFTQHGHLVIQGIQLTDNSTLAFAFRTRSVNATLMFQSSELKAFRKRRTVRNSEGVGYLAFYLYRGFLVVHLGTDSSQKSKVLTLRSEAVFDDGQLHSVFFTRSETLVRLRVDDREIASGTLGDQEIIGGTSSQLFIGGFPDHVKPSANEMPIIEPLIGCISNIFVDYHLVPIIPELHFATIGSCPVEQIFALPTLKRATDAEPLLADEQNVFDRKTSKLSLHITEPTLATDTQQLYADGIEPIIVKTINDVMGANGDGETDSELHNPGTPKTIIAVTTMMTTAVMVEKEVLVTKSELVDTKMDSTELTTTMNNDPKQCGPKLLVEKDGKGAAQFGITEASHSRLNFESSYVNVNLFKIELAFRTPLPNGILWIWANYKSYTRFFYLTIVNGWLQLEVRGPGEPKVLIYQSKKLDDNKWHSVRILKQNREILVEVDTYPAQFMRNVPSPKVIRKRMYVGGVISRHRKLFNLTVPSFSGCIRNFMVNDILYDLFESARDVIPCSVVSVSSYVHEGGYMAFGSLNSTPQQRRGDIQISVQFRPVVASGLIFGLLTSRDPESTRIALYLRNGLLTFEMMYKKDSRDLKHVFGENLCDGAWHNVTLSISHANIIIITVDGHKERLPSKTSVEAGVLFRSLPLYVGGVTASAAQKIGILSLIGCYRDLQLYGKPVDFKDAKKLSKVLPNSCLFFT